MFTTRAETQNGQENVGTSRESCSTRLSPAFIVSSLFTASLLSFSLGRAVRNNTYQHQVLSSPPILQPPHTLSLPTPVLPEGKKKPNADYSSKYFNTLGVTSRKSDVLLDDRERPRSRHSPGGSGFEVLAAGSVNQEKNYTIDDEDEENEGEGIHQPKGQHLLVDIKNVDASFLNSEEQLATAMISLISQSELTLLSYHCHGLEPMGVTCVGVLLESHVSFHTWPIPGVITLDLFTCGPKSLTPLVSVIEKLFAIPQKTAITKKGGETLHPRVIWAHKKRGFDFSDDDWNREDVEHERYLLGWREYEMKTQVAHEQTSFQEFEVLDVIDSRMNKIEEYERSLSKDGSYESQHPEFFKPDRVVYLDKIMQSRLSGVEAYHEALVHPAMLAHTDPRRVAIIGGGEGATLREVLKHKTVQKCVMVEIDGEMVAASKKHLPQWNNCSDLAGSAGSCFDDPRAEIYFEDAVGWFINRYSEKDQIDAADNFDVIIMDALDPDSQVGFSDVLYGSMQFIQALKNSLSKDGILIFQSGIDTETSYAGDTYTGQGKSLNKMKHLLKEVGFEKMTRYAEMHGGFRSPWSFHVAFSNSRSQVSWYANPAEVDLQLSNRAVATLSGEFPFYYFDGATMQGYQFASRVAQESFCRTEKTDLCLEGQGFDPHRENAPISALEVKQSAIPNAGRGLHFKQAFPAGTYLAIETAVHGLYIMPLTFALMKKMANAPTFASAPDLWKSFEPYAYGYGFATDFYGDKAYIVDASILTFINHGCNSTNNVGRQYPVNELTADSVTMPDDFTEDPIESAFFDPFIDRNHVARTVCGDHLREDVEVGTELLDNYLTYLTEENWSTMVAGYRAQCEGQGLGIVSFYEKKEETAYEKDEL